MPELLYKVNENSGPVMATQIRKITNAYDVSGLMKPVVCDVGAGDQRNISCFTATTSEKRKLADGMFGWCERKSV